MGVIMESYDLTLTIISEGKTKEYALERMAIHDEIGTVAWKLRGDGVMYHVSQRKFVQGRSGPDCTCGSFVWGEVGSCKHTRAMSALGLLG